MVIHQIWLTSLRAFFLSSALAPSVAFAEYPYIPSTPLQQISELSSVANRTVSLKLFPHNVQGTLARPPYQHDYQTYYQRSSGSERRVFSERIGELGAERYAADQKWKTLLSPHGRELRIGPDSIYWNPQSGRVHVIEAKGGSGRVGVSYGTPQGTNKNTIRSAKGILVALDSKSDRETPGSLG